METTYNSDWWLGRDNQRDLADDLRVAQGKWVITGAAGFIGSHLVETLLRLGKSVTGLDNFSTGSRDNLLSVQSRVGAQRWNNFSLITGDIRDAAVCRAALDGASFVLHQAALGSVPRSVGDPVTTHDVNATGFVNVLEAARRTSVKRIVYASSSSVYGDDRGLPKKEERLGRALSPYAVTKRVNELYADIYAHSYAMEVVGLRYFNVYGPRQNPLGGYASVIPKWIYAMMSDQQVEIFGDGTTSRDFCFIDNVVQGNLRAALVHPVEASPKYNIAAGGRTSLTELFDAIRCGVQDAGYNYNHPVIFLPSRSGDVLHSQADVEFTRSQLGYVPTAALADGLSPTIAWYHSRVSRSQV
jgi:UDP-N-acetylglucosamine 4-epimerase